VNKTALEIGLIAIFGVVVIAILGAVANFFPAVGSGLGTGVGGIFTGFWTQLSKLWGGGSVPSGSGSGD